MQSVFVGLSGGVDSAVSAALLKERGYHVTGVFIKIWQPEFIECTWEKDRIDAMRVAAALDIPFREVDLSNAYQKQVVQEMTRGYAAGYTPNPDVSCNEKIKFGAFAKWALENGADMVATGHYARIKDDSLYRGVDIEKDQSYFLYRIERSMLSQTLFPVGELTKVEVRKIAQRLNLPVAHKHDSQGLCFVGDVSMRDFLKRFVSVQEGVVVDTKGAVVGRHEGAPLYTVGQRHGFTLENSAVPHYVMQIDVPRNRIVVSPNRDDCEKTRSKLRDSHWLCDVELPLDALVQARYREKPVAAQISKESAVFEKPHIISPGQDLVIFDGERVLGGARLV